MSSAGARFDRGVVVGGEGFGGEEGAVDADGEGAGGEPGGVDPLGLHSEYSAHEWANRVMAGSIASLLWDNRTALLNGYDTDANRELVTGAFEAGQGANDAV